MHTKYVFFNCVPAEVQGLIHMKEYMFRVRAVNAIGESDALETSKGVVAKNPYG
jgi:hypothetical protein